MWNVKAALKGFTSGFYRFPSGWASPDPSPFTLDQYSITLQNHQGIACVVFSLLTIICRPFEPFAPVTDEAEKPPELAETQKIACENGIFPHTLLTFSDCGKRCSFGQIIYFRILILPSSRTSRCEMGNLW